MIADRLQVPTASSASLLELRDQCTMTVCTRPFRAQGPRLEVERIGDKVVVHNYGHGGSGWSLSWGSGSIARDNALATGERDIAVIGCGALGLTSALLLQRAGARVTIYTRELPPNVQSSLATGVWSPDSRICLEQHATPSFRKSWEQMARQSWQSYQGYVGLADQAVEYIDHYELRDAEDHVPSSNGRPPFASRLESELLCDLLPAPKDYPPGSHPFGSRYVRSSSWLMFNLSSYVRLLMLDFLSHGGQIQTTEFRTPADLAGVRQRTLVNSTGYGARALFNDTSIVPVRGQLARVHAQPDIHYGLMYKGTSFVPRRDGMVFQMLGDDDYYGYADEDVTPDRAEADRAIRTIAAVFQT